MKRLNELFDCPYETEIKSIKINSKEIKAGDLFVCTYGVTADRHDFIDDAIKNGASAIVVMKDVGKQNVPIIRVENTNDALHEIANKFYDYPLDKLKILGVTGTDGKTSTALIAKYLLGDKCAYIGSNGRICSAFKKDTKNTTPDADKMYMYLDEFVKAGCDTVVLEASSEAFFRNRLPNYSFDAAAYTNITSDHINIHKTWENYFESKMQLFLKTKAGGYSILNKDDKHYKRVLKYTKKSLTYGKEKADLSFTYELAMDSTKINFTYKDKSFSCVSPLTGDFNVYNLAAALLLAKAAGQSFEDSLKNLDKIELEGRLEKIISENGVNIIIDYAHTFYAIEAIVNMYKAIAPSRVIVLTGAAGARDKEKRPIISKFLIENTDYLILTTDDPFTEDPIEILKDLEEPIKSFENYEVIVDRKEAIAKAIEIAKKDDILLILGRGHENFQTVGYERIPLNDKEEVLKTLYKSQ